MTTNVLIANKNLIALGADEKMTLYNDKTHGGVCKIFPVPDNFSGGIMINGDMDFEGIPLKSLINDFYTSYDFSTVNSILEIKNRFLQFLSSKSNSTNPEIYLEDLLQFFKERIRLSDFSKFISDEVRAEIPQFITHLDSFDHEFDDVIPEDFDKSDCNVTLWQIFSYYLSFEGTGIIFAGYNRNQFFPSFVEINIYFNNGGEIVHDVVESVENSENPIIRVYANNHEAYTFLTGVSGDFEHSLSEFSKEENAILLNSFSEFLYSREKLDHESRDEIFNFLENLIQFKAAKRQKFILDYKFDSFDFISDYTGNLPCAVIYNLVCELISLTSTKQKITPDIETVGDNIDVAVIEPFKKFKWVKF